MTTKKSINAVKKVRAVFSAEQKPMTLKDIAKKCDLQPNEISMAFCYLIKKGDATRELITNTTPKERKVIWQYSYNVPTIKPFTQV